MSGFIDGQMSPLEAPMWSRCLYLETGSSALPQFRLVNDTDEYILDGRIRLVGWKYAIEEIDEATLQDFKRKSNGRLTFRIIPTSGLPQQAWLETLTLYDCEKETRGDDKMQNEEPTIVSAPGYVGKSNFRDGKAVDDLVRRDERFITTEIGPITLGPGEELNILDEKEKGEIIYIKVVTDNPYTNVYLELDDYRNDPNGETHAELLYSQRTSNAEGQFYIETDGSNGKGYPMIWNPQTNPTAYSKRHKLRVTNPLRRNSNLYGSDLSYSAKGGQPTPIQPLHMGGGSFTHSGLAAVSLETLSKAIANPIGANGAYSVDAVVNEAVFNSDGQKLGEGNPYAGLAGKPIFRRALSYARGASD